MLQAVRGVDAVQIGTDLCAEPAPCEGMIGITVKTDRAAIAHLDEGGASVRAVVRAGAAEGDRVGRRSSEVGTRSDRVLGARVTHTLPTCRLAVLPTHVRPPTSDSRLALVVYLLDMHGSARRAREARWRGTSWGVCSGWCSSSSPSRSSRSC